MKFRLGTLVLVLMFGAVSLNAVTVTDTQSVEKEVKKTKKKKTKKKKTKKKKTKKKKSLKRLSKKKKAAKKSVDDQHRLKKHLRAKVGFGYDSNPFLTPSQSYVDYSTTLQPSISPVVKSGFFIPLYMDFYSGKKLKKNLYYGFDAKIQGRFFVDAGMRNGNEHNVILTLDTTYYTKRFKSNKKGYKGALFVRDHHETYVDHDNGADKNTRFDGSGTYIEDRYQYQSQGIDLSYFDVRRKWELWLSGHYELLDYVKPTKWSELDHNYYYLSLKGMKKSKRSRSSLEYRYAVRDYEFRPSYYYDATKITLTSNLGATVPLEYTFHELRASYEKKHSKRLKSSIKYMFQKRTDDYLGYNDSIYQRIRLQTRYRWNKKLRQAITFAISDRSYERAKAYDKLVTQEDKMFRRYEAGTKVTYALRHGYRALGDFLYQTQQSSDKRYDYDRYVLSVGLSKKF